MNESRRDWTASELRAYFAKLACVLTTLTTVVALGSAAHGESDCQPIQGELNWVHWAVEEGGNGHWYALTDPGLWEVAECQAVKAGGHLVTVTDAAEDEWIYYTFSPGAVDWVGWIGLYQDHDDPDYFEPDGGWKWVSGQPVTYTNWYGLEPNDLEGEDWAVLEVVFPPLQWNDLGVASSGLPADQVRGIIERESDPGIGDCDEPVASRDLRAPRPFYCDVWGKTVELALDVPAGALAVSVEDAPPSGWSDVTSISDGGWYDAVHHKVKWGPFFEPVPASVSYTVQPPAGASGEQCFGPGTVSVDGENTAVCGDTCIDYSCCPFAPADDERESCDGCADCGEGCQDGRVEMNEVIGYACAWKKGCNDDIGGMTRSAYLWRAGECYCWDEGSGNWNAYVCASPASGCCEGGVAGAESAGVARVRMEVESSRDDGVASETVRMPRKSLTETRLPVRRFAVDAEVPPGTQATGVEVAVPKGWTVTTISSGGVYDAAHHKIKWGPFFGDGPLGLTFEATGARGSAGLHAFTGTISFDGVNQPFGMVR